MCSWWYIRGWSFCVNKLIGHDCIFNMTSDRIAALWNLEKNSSIKNMNIAFELWIVTVGDGYSDMSDTTSTGTPPPAAPRGPRNPSNGTHKGRGALTERASCSQGDKRGGQKTGSTSKRATRYTRLHCWPVSVHPHLCRVLYLHSIMISTLDTSVTVASFRVWRQPLNRFHLTSETFFIVVSFGLLYSS